MVDCTTVAFKSENVTISTISGLTHLYMGPKCRHRVKMLVCCFGNRIMPNSTEWIVSGLGSEYISLWIQIKASTHVFFSGFLLNCNIEHLLTFAQDCGEKLDINGICIYEYVDGELLCYESSNSKLWLRGYELSFG